MTRSRLGLIGLLGVLSLACSQPVEVDFTGVEREARAFMQGYGEDLENHDVAAIADRYDRRGAYLMGHGRKELRPFESIRSRYRDTWQGPAAFEWQDLSFEVITGDAVMVAGTFAWTIDETLPPLSMSYSGLLLRQDGELRIRLEDESMELSQVQMFIEQMGTPNE